MKKAKRSLRLSLLALLTGSFLLILYTQTIASKNVTYQSARPLTTTTIISNVREEKNLTRNNSKQANE